MQTRLAPEVLATDTGRRADEILRACVHCGFCNATCPTYGLLGNELDGPRGRIYLIKQVFEGERPTRATQMHLDRCLTCRNCETTCPSGVEYGALLDVGRQLVSQPSELHVVHVLVDITPLEAGEVWGVVDPQTRIEQMTKILRERLADKKYAGISQSVVLGEPAHGIAQFAQDKGADLIVIPSHGRTGLTRLLIGSVAERVVRLAHCPVLVLRK